MRRPMPITRQRFTLLATAVAALFAPSIAVQAQSFSQSGGTTNSTSPNNLLPYAGSPTSLDFTGDTVYIGNGAIGSFSVLAGALLKADALAIATGGTGIGTFTLSGVNPGTAARSTVLLGGSLDVGSWGIGTLTVSGGALLDATTNPAACGTQGAPSCYNQVGNGAGSTGTLTITGAGSEVRTLRNFTVAQTTVVTNPPSSGTFGTPGGTTDGTVSVLAGGTLRTERAVVGANNASPNGLGTEKANGTVVVDGTGSLWELTHNSIDATNNVAGLTIGVNANGTGNVTVQNGGTMRVVGSSASDTPTTFMNLGLNGGKGTLTLTGSNSKLEMVSPAVAGAGSVIQAGRSGAGSEGTFNVLAGATASATFLNVGRDGAKGTVLIDGGGSLVTMSGLGTWASNQIGGSAATIGWNGGDGKVTVSNGGRLLVTDGGVDTSTSAGSMAINLGYIGGTGKMFIDGSGSSVEITSTSIAPAAGAPDNFNPFMAVGRDSGGSGELTITNGGKLLLTGNASSTPTFGRGTSLDIGGYSDSVVSGSGMATVSGPGSQIRLEGADTFVAVGRNGNGTLNLDKQALLHIGNGGINVGRAASGVGVLNVDNSSIEISGQYTGDPTIGAFMSIGNRGGNGTANIGNGSVVTITNLGSAGASLNVGGTSNNPLGTGVLNLNGGSKISVVAASGLASMSVGRDDTGSATLTGAGTQIDLGDGTLHVGRLATGIGTVSIESSSKILTGNTNIGGSSDTVAGGTGSVTVTGLGSELRASGATGAIGVGRGGNGTLIVTDQAKISAIGTYVGRFAGGTGQLAALNATLEFAGQQTTGLLSGAFFSIGTGGGTGTAALTGSTVTLTNPGSAGASVNVGGSGNFPTGNGTLTMVNSSITLSAGAGLGSVSIGRSGTGSATLSASTIDNVGGNVYVGREAGSTGVLTMTNGSVINAAFVGVGVSAPGTDKSIGPAGGTGILVLNDSTINASDRFELGAGSVLTGNNGVINVASKVDPVNGVIAGPVVIAGTIAPGNSPGRMRINCDLIMLPGSSIVLDIGLDQNGQIVVDNLILGSEALFDLKSAHIQFSFLAGVNPEVVADAGGLNLDLYLLTATGNEPPVPLSERFTGDQTWDTVVTASNVTAKSTDYVITDFAYNPDTGGATFVQSPVPEPSTWGMLFLGLCAVGAVARRRQAAARRD